MSLVKFKLLDASALAKAIGSVGRQKVAMDKAVQSAAVQCIAQSIVHRNATPAMSLFDALSGSVRRDALVVYLEKFGNLQWDKSKKAIAFRDAKRPCTDDYMAEVEAVQWYTLKPEPKIKSEYDADKMIGDVLDRLLKAATKEGVTVKGKELLGAVHEAYAKFKAAQILGGSTAEPTEADITAAKADPALLAKLQAQFPGHAQLKAA